MSTSLPKYKSHKIVQAAPIIGVVGPGPVSEEDSLVVVVDVEGEAVEHTTIPGFGNRFNPSESDMGYLMVYEDGYESWSPSEPFEEGYTLITSDDGDPEPPAEETEREKALRLRREQLQRSRQVTSNMVQPAYEPQPPIYGEQGESSGCCPSGHEGAEGVDGASTLAFPDDSDPAS